jgi:dihydroorotase (multifunctional complex type)
MTESADLAVDGAVMVSAEGRQQASLYAKDGRIIHIGEAGLPSRQRVDASGLLALPGFVDTHVHLMEPASAEREDWAHGTRAAAASGVTTVIEHTHAQPVRTEADLKAKREYLRSRSLVDFALAAHAWPTEVAGLGDLWSAGVAFFKVFTCTTHGIPGFGSGLLEETLGHLARLHAIALVHCEDEAATTLAGHRLRAEGREDGGVIPEWRSREAEILAVREVLELAHSSGSRVVIAHASHRAVVDLVADARAAGTAVAVESCPQYFLLREDEVATLGGLRKFTPPARARSEADFDDMWTVLGPTKQIDLMSSDHAPSTRTQKGVAGIWDVHFGLPGLDTTSSFLIDAALRGRLSLERIVELYATAPARTYGLRSKGQLRVGADADFALVNAAAERTLSDDAIYSKAGWTPYAGMPIRGRVVSTYVRGVPVFVNGAFPAGFGHGTFVAGMGLSS